MGGPCPLSAHFRYVPESRHKVGTSHLSRRAMCGRLRVGKSFLHVCSIGRCSHVFGLLARYT